MSGLMRASRSAMILVPLLGAALGAAVVASAWLAWQPTDGRRLIRAAARSRVDEVRPPTTLPALPPSTIELSALGPPAPTAPADPSAPTPPAPIAPGAATVDRSPSEAPAPAAGDLLFASPPPPFSPKIETGDSLPLATNDLESESRTEPIVEPEEPASVGAQPASPAPPLPAPDAEHAAAAPAHTNISGAWLLSNEVQSASYAPFRGLRLSYRAQLVQDGAKIVGSGVKWAENGRTLPDSQRTPISFEGRVENRTVSLRFTEQGKRRTSRGVLTWSLAPDGEEMHGTFSSTAASSSGVSFARRFPG